MINLLVKILLIGIAITLTIALNDFSPILREEILYIKNDIKLLSMVLIFYVFLLAIPYFPSVEFALVLLLILGFESSFLIYISTVLGLILPFFVGRFFSDKYCRKVENIFAGFNFLKRVNKVSPVLSLIIFLNMPGNIVLGGGGGIGIMYGTLKIITPIKYFVGVSIAALPIFIVGYMSIAIIDFYIIFKNHFWLKLF